jgi:hypothetical protein
MEAWKERVPWVRDGWVGIALGRDPSAQGRECKGACPRAESSKESAGEVPRDLERFPRSGGPGSVGHAHPPPVRDAKRA